MLVHGRTDNTSAEAPTPALLLNADGSLNTGSGATAAQVQGNVASGAADSGNPLKVGGVYNSTLPTVTTGQRADIQTNNRGLLMAVPTSSAGTAFANQATNADGQSASGTALASAADLMSYNGATWDRVRGNIDTAALITAAGATTTQTSADQTNYNGRGVKAVLDMTVVGTGSVTIAIQGKDAASGKYYAILTGAAVTTNSTNVYEVYPGATVAANASVSSALPRVWRVVVTANNANAATYTVGASVIL